MCVCVCARVRFHYYLLALVLKLIRREALKDPVDTKMRFGTRDLRLRAQSLDSTGRLTKLGI